jgi:hypothetical protein
MLLRILGTGFVSSYTQAQVAIAYFCCSLAQAMCYNWHPFLPAGWISSERTKERGYIRGGNIKDFQKALASSCDYRYSSANTVTTKVTTKGDPKALRQNKRNCMS